MPQSVAQLDLWIAAHGDDARLGRALGNRCWAKALLGQDLKSALKDCDSALALGPESAWSLYGRGIAKVRRNQAAEGQADLGAAAAIWPSIADDFAKRGITP